MADLIQATVVGRLTRDAELKETSAGSVCEFRVAATPYKSEALFFAVTLWGKRGEALHQYLGKGQQVVVVGDYSERSFEHNGEQRTSKEIRANAVALVGSRPEREAATGAGSDDDWMNDLA